MTINTTSTGAREVAMILRWRDARGDEAHCLARLHVPLPPAKPVALLSEIRSNVEHRGLIVGIAAVGEALLAAAPPDVAVDPADIVWIAHHGEFSSYDHQGASESFIALEMRWDGRQYHNDIHGDRRLRGPEITEALGNMPLEPVPEVLRKLDWRYQFRSIDRVNSAPHAHFAMDQAGRPIGTPARDYANMMERLAHCSNEVGLSGREVED